MDIFCEFLVKKKSASDKLKRFGLSVLCAAVCVLIFYVSVAVFRPLITFMPLLIAAAIYLTVIYSRNFSIEYEYIFTNGVLDIDIIKGRIKREKFLSVPCRSIEYMGPVRSVRASQNRVVNAIYDEKRPGKYIVTYSEHGTKTDLYFQPPEKLLVSMKKYNPKNINLE